MAIGRCQEWDLGTVSSDSGQPLSAPEGVGSDLRGAQSSDCGHVRS